jgi:hypothetical protein
MLVLLFAVAPFVPEPLPEGAIARLGSMNRLKGARTDALAYSPDGKRLAWASADLTSGLCFLDLRTGATVARQIPQVDCQLQPEREVPLQVSSIVDGRRGDRVTGAGIRWPRRNACARRGR